MKFRSHKCHFVVISTGLLFLFATMASAKEVVVKQSKWVVVTSIFSPTEQVKKLSRIPGWQLLVVGDQKTPKNWSLPNTIFLDVKTQLDLGYRVLKFLPWNAYTRKVVGYLYAIQHGAEFIYDTDDDNAPDSLEAFESHFVLENTTRGLVWTNDLNDLVTNPYAHFGQPSVWPRGYPLDQIGKLVGNFYTTCQMKTPLIQQGIVNGDPDVDAIFRLTRKKAYRPLDIHFDSSAPPMILPAGVLAPFNSQNTLFRYNAFWALLLPTTVTFRVTDIWRGYWAQPLLWGIGSHLGFYPPYTKQIRNAHTYLMDFAEEDQLYKQSGSLVTFLTDWECKSVGLYDCMVNLTSTMAEQGFWGLKEVNLVKAWISDLKSVGYKEPAWVTESESESKSPCLPNTPESFVIFHGVEPEVSDERVHLQEFCDMPISSVPVKNVTTFPNTLLVVTFNIPHYKNIWLLDLIYRPHYPNILYCGRLLDPSNLLIRLESDKFIASNVQKFSFVHANVTNGFFIYECALRAIEMNYSNISGYLMLSDDALWNFQNSKHYNPHETWFPMTMGDTNAIKYYDVNNPPGKMYKAQLNPSTTAFQIPGTERYCWNLQFGYNSTKKTLEIINDPKNQNEYIQQFRSNRQKFGFNPSVAIGAFSDLYYFPKPKQNLFYEIATIFRDNEVYLEIGIPMLMLGLTSPEDVVDLCGRNDYIPVAIGAKYIRENYEPSDDFIHPIKLGQIIKHREYRAAYCETYVKYLLTESNQEQE